MADILLITINAKWIHPSLALRLLKANLGKLEEQCQIAEFALRQNLDEKTGPVLAARPKILGISVSIWNHSAILELLKELWKAWGNERPVIVLGGPEVSFLPPDAEIFKYADYCIRGEGEIRFRELCEAVLINRNLKMADAITACDGYTSVHLAEIKSSYHLYTDEDLHKKLIYAEASRGCPYGCEFCLSSHSGTVREFPLEPFLAEMEILVSRGVKTIKFLDRTFNLNIKRAQRIMEFFLEKILQRQSTAAPLVVHFEMIPSRFPAELLETISRFPPGTLRLEIGIQTLNPGVAAIIGRPSDTELELASLRFLAKNTNAVIHADLIAGLPGEGIDSFGKGFDLLREALLPPPAGSTFNSRAEIQPGILKLLPGAPIARHSVEHKMRYSSSPPYEILETAAMPAADLNRLKNFARFWELIVNRNLFVLNTNLSTGSVFKRFLNLSDFLLLHFGQNWGIAKKDLMDAVLDWNDRAYL